MTGWKIPMFNRKCIFIYGGFSIVMLVFGGRSISYFILGKEAAVFFSKAGPRSPGRLGEARWSSKVFTTVMLWYDFIAWVQRMEVESENAVFSSGKVANMTHDISWWPLPSATCSFGNDLRIKNYREPLAEPLFIVQRPNWGPCGHAVFSRVWHDPTFKSCTLNLRFCKPPKGWKTTCHRFAFFQTAF